MEKLTIGLIFMMILMVGFISYLVATMDSGEVTMNTTSLSTGYFSSNQSTNLTRVNNTREVTQPATTINSTDRARVNYYKKALGIT
jgi:uncharacterized membrane protein (DUF4010 family)